MNWIEGKIQLVAVGPRDPYHNIVWPVAPFTNMV